MDYGDLARANRRRRRRREQGKVKKTLRTLFLTVGVAGAIGIIGILAGTGYLYSQVAREVPELQSYSSPELAQTSVVYDVEGNVIGELYNHQNRYVVPLEDIDPTLRHAVVAIEDHRFRKHHGVDFEAIARAAWANITTLSIQEGGSTLTQQLMKNTYIPENMRSAPSFGRKLVEASLAWQYEDNYSKDEILESYLNTVYFGADAYGVEAAARTYFDKSASELTLPESAMIAGIINLPGAYDPFEDPESAQKRRDVVLNNMLRYGYITQRQHDRAVKSELNLSRGRIGDQTEDEEYFLDAVRKELIREYGKHTIYEGGLEIHTTLDPQLQNYATQAVDSVVNPEAGDPSASLVSVDPATGAVRAMVGGSDFDDVKFNLATQAKRQPGSAFKTFVLAEAIKQGISPDTTYTSRDLNIPWPPDSPTPQYYSVGNYGGAQRGSISIEKATEASDNTVFVQLAMDLGLQKVVNMAHDMGINSELEPYPSLAIGGLGEGVTPLEMAAAYATLPNGGVHMKPYLVDEITREEDGETEVIEDHRMQGERALSQDEAAAVTQVLRGVVEEGTASQFHDLDSELGRPSAGKTGTTEQFADAWFTGYVPQLSTAVWVGYPESRQSMVNIRGYAQINGENFPLDIWSAYMQQAVSQYPVQQFDEPSSALDLEDRKPGEPEGGETTASSSTDREQQASASNAGQPSYQPPVVIEPQAPRQPQPVPQQQPQPAPQPQPTPQPVQPAPQPPRGEGGSVDLPEGFPFD